MPGTRAGAMPLTPGGVSRGFIVNGGSGEGGFSYHGGGMMEHHAVWPLAAFMLLLFLGLVVAGVITVALLYKAIRTNQHAADTMAPAGACRCPKGCACTEQNGTCTCGEACSCGCGCDCGTACTCGASGPEATEQFPKEPLDILAYRLATGRIDVEDYQVRVAALSAS